VNSELLRRWVRATWIGWLLGIPCIVVLALLGEAIGIGGAQVFVGAGMGVSVGAMQSRVVRNLLGSGAAWFWSCVGGLGGAFLLTDVGALLGVPYSLPLAVALGGLLAGIWQAMLLHERMGGSSLWILASVAGWELAAAMVSVADVLVKAQTVRGWIALVAFLAIVALGGLVLGLVTGFALSRLSRAASR
jgi:hypothetical protein